MLAKLFSYAASKAAGEAVDGIARRAVWGGLAAVLLLFAFALTLMISYWMLEPYFGGIQSAVILASSCALAGVISLAIPGILDKSKKAAIVAQHQDQGSVAQTVAAVKDETEAAVDYFGAVQVVASAFMFGLGTARQLRRKV